MSGKWPRPTITDDGVRFIVWDEEAGEHITISRAEMVEQMFTMAETLRPGSPAAGEWQRKGLEIAAGATLGFMTETQLTDKWPRVKW